MGMLVSDGFCGWNLCTFQTVAVASRKSHPPTAEELLIGRVWNVMDGRLAHFWVL